MATMGDVGEKGFIAALLPQLVVADHFVGGFGHDASVIDVGLGKQMLVMKIDRAATPVATLHGWDTYQLWGRLAVTSNCSDILAMGGVPKAVMVCICVPPEWKTSDVADIVLGCQAECLAHEVAFVGGDTKQSPSPELVGSAFGLIQADNVCLRTGAQPGQALVVAGTFGGYMGAYLQLRSSRLDSDELESVDQANWLRYITQPSAKWEEASVMRALGGVAAAMDTSDGLFDALTSMGRGEIGTELFLDAIPYHPYAMQCAQLLNIPLFNFAFGVGDWNIVYAVEPHYVPQMYGEAERAGANLTVIGRFTDTPSITARDQSGHQFTVAGIVNEHFRSRMEDEGSFMNNFRSQATLITVPSGVPVQANWGKGD